MAFLDIFARFLSISPRHCERAYIEEKMDTVPAKSLQDV